MAVSWALTSCLLIAVVLLLRFALGRNISARLRYALWLVVLVRLLIRNNLLSALLLAAGALLFQGLMDWFFNYVLLRGSEPWYMLLHLTLPNALYTLILSPLLYGLTRLIAHILRKRE